MSRTSGTPSSPAIGSGAARGTSEAAAARALLEAVAPLVERVGGEVVPAEAAGPEDVPLRWQGELVAAVRLPIPAEPLGLDVLLEQLAGELGPLDELARPMKQRAVRLLEERGAFEYRKSAELIAEALGVSRFTVYNYLNRGAAG